MEKWITALISIGFLIITMSFSSGSVNYLILIEGVIVVVTGCVLLLRVKSKNKDVKKDNKKMGGKK